MLTHFWENRTLKVGSNLQSNIVFMFEGKSHEFLERQIILYPYFVQNEKFKRQQLFSVEKSYDKLYPFTEFNCNE